VQSASWITHDKLRITKGEMTQMFHFGGAAAKLAGWFNWLVRRFRRFPQLQQKGEAQTVEEDRWTLPIVPQRARICGVIANSRLGRGRAAATQP